MAFSLRSRVASRRGRFCMIRKLVWVVPFVLALSSVIEAKPNKPPKAPTSAPEFDPSASGAVLALLLGGAWVLSGRLRRRGERD
jgi:hypothetical protein